MKMTIWVILKTWRTWSWSSSTEQSYKCSLKLGGGIIDLIFLQLSCFRSKQRGSKGVLYRETGKDKKTGRQTAGLKITEI